MTDKGKQKRRQHSAMGWLCMLLASVFVFSSCLKGDDDNDVIHYSDTAITAFSLGSLNRTVHTRNSAGADSTYVIQIAGSGYKFYIDQQKQDIYNPDSLPAGTDAAHVVCTITSKNSGVVMLKSPTSDSLRIYSSTDSIDFSKPRVLRVFSNDGSGYRDYTVSVNVHQQLPDEFNWNMLMSEEQHLAKASRLRLAALGSRCFAFGTAGDGSQTFMMDLQQCADEKDAYAPITLSGDVTNFVATRGSELLVLEGTKLNRYALSESGKLTVEVDLDRNVEGIAQLLGADGESIYARGTNGDLLVSADNCLTWAKEEMDHDAALLPTGDLSFITVPSRTNADIHNLLLIGNRSETEFPADATAQVWGKSVEPGITAAEWYFVSQYECSYPLPRMRSLSAICYDQLILAVGGTGFGGSKQAAFSKFFVSEDGGINWRGNSLYSLPKNFSSNDVFAMTVDADNHIWMVCGESGQIWRGRLNRMGWETEQKAFTN